MDNCTPSAHLSPRALPKRIVLLQRSNHGSYLSDKFRTTSHKEMDYGFFCAFCIGITSSLPNSSQSSPKSSMGCCARSEPLPQYIESTEQYLSHPQQIRSGCAGCIGIFLAISPSFKCINRTMVLNPLRGHLSSCDNKSRRAPLCPTNNRAHPGRTACMGRHRSL